MGPDVGSVGLSDSPIVGPDDTIYVGSYLDGQSRFLAINPDGTLKWSADIWGGTTEGIPALGSDGAIYFTTSAGVNQNGLLYCLNPDGSLRWTGKDPSLTHFWGVGTGLALEGDGTIYLCDSVGGALKAVNTDGTLKWSFPLGARSWSSPAITNDGTIYVGQDDHVLFGLNPNGSEKWSVKLSEVASYYACSPAVGEDGILYFGDWDRFYAITPSGQVAWSVEFGVTSSPAIGSDGTIYVGGYLDILEGHQSGLAAIEPTGSMKWFFPVNVNGRVQSSPAVGNDGTIYFGSNEVNPEYADRPEYDDSHVYALNPDGSIKWKYKTGGFVVSSPAITSNGLLVVSSLDGNLYAFSSEESPEPPEPPWSFVHMTDVHVGAGGLFWDATLLFWDATERFVDAINEINLIDPRPDFILVTGDIVERATMADGRIYEEYLDALASLNPEINVYTVPGNHDRYYTDFDLCFYNDYVNSTRPSGTINLIPPHDYVFEHKGFNFIGLDSGRDVDTPFDLRGTGLSNPQMTALMEKTDHGSPKIVFMHHPAIHTGVEELVIANNPMEFVTYCQLNNVQLVLSGHTHEDHVFNSLFWELTSPKDCYGGDYTLFIQTPSAGRGVESGTFPHGYRVIYVNEGSACPLPYKYTSPHPKIEVFPRSPVDLHVYDSFGRHTGMNVSGKSERDIPDSFYFSHYTITGDDGSIIETLPEKVILFNLSADYRYKVVGTEQGTYGLDISFTGDGQVITFEAVDIPTLHEAEHMYAVDWLALSAGKEGVTIEIDSDGDGVFERTIIADEDLTSEEFALQTETVVDFEPDTLNLRSPGKVVTAYIELPEGFDVSKINVSSLKLNSLVSALLKPITIGDHDVDGIADLMVKFDRQQVIEVLGSGTQMVTLTGRLSDGRPLAGIDFIRVIDGTEAEAVVPEFESTVPEGFIADMEDNLQTTTDDSVDIGGEDAFGVKEAIGFMLFEASETINELGPESFNNEESAFELACAINDVFTMLDEGMYFEVMVIIDGDILERMDGYTNIGQPDGDDWVTSIDGQVLLYPLLTETIELLESML